MDKYTKKGLLTAAFLTLLGLMLFAAAMTAHRWDFTRLSTVTYETNTYPVSTALHSISITAHTEDIVFLPAGDGQCKVVCYERQDEKHAVAVEEGTLSIQMGRKTNWYENFGITMETPKITVYLPEAAYTRLHVHSSTGDIAIPKDFSFEQVEITASTADVTCRASASDFIKIKTSTGDIRAEDLSAGSLELSVSTGKVTARSITCPGDITISVSTGDVQVTDAVCGSVTATGSTGHITLQNVVASEGFSIRRSTGDVTLDSCDAGEILIDTDTGDVRGTLRSDKVFLVSTDTGDVDVPQTLSGGKCQIHTSTGDIQLRIAK